ncbi:MAG: thioredoxin domain-containing protein [Haloferacaceae archaeon]
MTGADGPSRRTVLGAVGAALAGVAGCVGDAGGGPTTDHPTDTLPAPTKGAPDAPVTVAAYEDFACPHCRTFALEVLPRLESAYVDPGRVRYVHNDFPVPVHERWSWAAAVAARAVQAEAGDDAFFAYATRLYRRQGEYSLDTFGRQAEAVGVDGAVVRRAVERGRYRPTVAADRREGRQRDVPGTPTVFVGDRRLGGYSYGTVADAVETAIERRTT